MSPMAIVVHWVVVWDLFWIVWPFFSRVLVRSMDAECCEAYHRHRRDHILLQPCILRQSILQAANVRREGIWSSSLVSYSFMGVLDTGVNDCNHGALPKEAGFMSLVHSSIFVNTPVSCSKIIFEDLLRF